MPFTVGQYLTKNDLDSQEKAHTLGYGVLNGLKVVPTDPASMDVQVETGKAYVADTLVEKGAVTDLTVGAADPTNPRKDIVVCNSAGTLSIVAGTPEAALPSGNVGVYTLNPEPPSIPANSIILAEIWVPAGATSITGSEIYDKRVSIADFLTHKADAAAHHAKYTDAEAQAIADALIATHAALATVHQDAPALIATHAGIAAAHHAKTIDASELTAGILALARLSGITNTQIAAGAAIAYTKLALTGKIKAADIEAAAGIPLSKLESAVCSDTEADGKITTHKGDASAHHAKTSKASEITSEQFPVDRMPRAASGFLEGKGAGVNPAYSALVEADIPAHMAKSKLAFTLNKLLKGAGGAADPTEIDVPTAAYGLLTVAHFQFTPATGDFDYNPEHLNDNDVLTAVSTITLDTYAEVIFLAPVHITQFRQYGASPENTGDGVWKIQYLDVNDVWQDWVTGIATRPTENWSNWDSTGGDVIAKAIKLVATTLDTKYTRSFIHELEVKY